MCYPKASHVSALQLCHEAHFRSIPQLVHLHALGRGELRNLEGFVDNLMRVCKIDSAAKTTGISPIPTLDLYTWESASWWPEANL